MTESLPMPITAPLSSAQRSQLLALVRRAAKAEIMPRFRRLGGHQIDQKTGPQDLVTEADRAAEAMITRGIQRLFPSALVIGEEHVSSNPKILEKIADAELCFTIDPVDGTWNYANGLANFGVMVAVLRFGLPQYGMLYDPVMDDVISSAVDETAEFVGRRGLRRTLSTSKGGALDSLTGYVSLPLLSKDKRSQMAAVIPQFNRIDTLRCACHEFRMLAQGNVDFLLASKMTAWDHPGGVVIARSAGGYAKFLDGRSYSADIRDGHLLVACNEITWNRVREVFDFLVDKPATPNATDEPAPESAEASS